MATLREKYHQLGSKINKINVAAQAVEEYLGDLNKENKADPVVQDIRFNTEVIREAVYELNKIVNEVKNLHYRQADPNSQLDYVSGAITQANQGLKLLFVDDEKSICEIHQKVYEKKGFHVEIAGTKDEAIASIKQTLPDIIILDLHLQDGTDGLNVLIFVKQFYPAVKVIVVTNEDNLEALDKVHTAGADEVLMKPLRLSSLEAKINAYVSDRKAS